MNQDTELDKVVKAPLVTDMVNLMCMKPHKRATPNLRTNRTAHKLLADVNKDRKKLTTVREIQMLTKDNYKSILRAEDYLILLESEEEFLRRGNFRKVFPTIESVEQLSHCLEVERPNNLLLWKYLELKKSGFDILQQVFN